MELQRDVPLAPYTTLGLGGAAQYWVEAEDEAAIPAALQWAETEGVPVLVLGGGSNLVVADAGFPGLVLRVATRGAAFSNAGTLDVHVKVQAGEVWDLIVARSVEAGLAGIECLSGIPGSVGATPMQNVGAYGQEVSDAILMVRAWDRVARQMVAFDAPGCHFGYRQSRFKAPDAQRYVVLEVTYRLRRGTPGPVRYGELSRALEGDRDSLSLRRRTVLRLRGGKGMVLDPSDTDTRSVGSFFLNPVVPRALVSTIEARADAGPMPAHPVGAEEVKLSAAWLIEKAGFPKGYGGPHVSISNKHTLALVHRGGGTTAELLSLAATIRDGVHERLGVLLTPEANLVNCQIPT